MNLPGNFEELLRRAGVWRGRSTPLASGVCTGFTALDDLLPGRGWPASGLTELLSTDGSRGALSLILPAIARLSQSGAWLIWVAPPYVPYAPALAAHDIDLTRLLIVDLPEETAHAEKALEDGRPEPRFGHNPGDQALWAYEQALRFSDCAAALLWVDHLSANHLRRLQVAAESGSTWGVLFRSARYAEHPSAAPCRLQLSTVLPAPTSPCAADTAQTTLEVTLLKARGGKAGQRCQVSV